MKASEVLKRYAQGRRDFRGENLRGQSFKGKDLSGADFSEAKLHGTNFTSAILREANFAGAKCGLQRRWATLLTILSWLLAGILCYLSGYTGYFVSLIIYFSILENQIISWVCLIVLIIFLVLRIYEGIRAVEAAAVEAAVVIALIAATGVTAGAAAVAVVAASVVGLAAVAVVAAVVAAAVAVAREEAVAAVALVVVAAVVTGIVEAGAAVKGAVAIGAVAIGAVAIGAVALAVLAIYAGWRAMRGYVKDGLVPSFAIAFAAMGGTNFRGADLTCANFTGARLKSTDLREATLTRVRWYGAKMLDRVRPGETYLKNTQVRQWLLDKGTDKTFDSQQLQGINLQGADLTDASFIDANLSEANLQDADLSRAKLVRTQLDKTDFTGATLTGACIEDWNINSTTNLDRVTCDYVYLREGKQERRPHDLNKNFAPGEFIKLFQKALETVDLIFREGVDWKAVAYSLKNAQVLNENTPLAIQSIENKGDGVVLIRVSVPKNADKQKIESNFWQGYEFAHKQLEAQYQARIEDKDKEINRLFSLFSQAQEQLGEVPKLMSEAKKEFNFHAPVGNVGNEGTQKNVAGVVQGDQVDTQHNYAPEQKKTLAEAAEEIQQLLAQLQSQGSSIEEAQQQVAEDLATKAKNNLTTKEKLIQWGQSLGDTAAQTTVSEAAKEVLKLALKFSGVLLP